MNSTTMPVKARKVERHFLRYLRHHGRKHATPAQVVIASTPELLAAFKKRYGELSEHVNMVASEHARRDCIRWAHEHGHSPSAVSSFVDWLKQDSFEPINKREFETMRAFFPSFFTGYGAREVLHRLLAQARFMYALAVIDFERQFIWSETASEPVQAIDNSIPF